jgi:hypothetical protein
MTSLKNVLVPLGFLTATALRFAPGISSQLSYCLIGALAWLGPVPAILSVFFCYLFNLLNPELAAPVEYAAILRYATLLSFFLASVYHAVHRGTTHLNACSTATAVTGLAVIAHSLLFSYEPAISITKAISWLTTTFGLLTSFAILTTNERIFATRIIYGLTQSTIVASALFANNSMGYALNGRGLQGIFSHPQVAGPLAALAAITSFSNILVSRKNLLLNVLLFSIGLVVLYLSQCRTAIAALLGGVSMSLTYTLIASRNNKPAGRINPRRLALFIVGIAILSFSFAPTLLDEAVSFLNKHGGKSTTLTEAYYEARGFTADAMIPNIKKHPLSGIGFGIGSNPSSMTVVTDPFLGLPIYAPVEKGIFPIAITEELGIPGLLIFTYWILVLLKATAGNGFGPLAAFIAIVLFNLAESTLTSPGGAGLINLLYLAWAANEGSKQITFSKAASAVEFRLKKTPHTGGNPAFRISP